MADGTYLHLGCGKYIWPDFINIDAPGNWSEIKPDVEADIRALPYPDNHADEIHAIHVIEHFFRWEVEDVLKEWVRVLKPGGKLILELPCLSKILPHFKDNLAINHMTLWALYGDPTHTDPSMVHKWCYSGHMMRELMEGAGLQNIIIKDPVYHVKERDMRLIGTKC